jgi:hypothetical protein
MVDTECPDCALPIMLTAILLLLFFFLIIGSKIYFQP